MKSQTVPETALFENEQEAVAAIHNCVFDLRSAEEQLREAVMGARAIKVSWHSIGSAMGISRQAVAERFGGDVRNHLVTAWHAIEIRLDQIGAARGLELRPLACLQLLTDEGQVDPALRERALELWSARAEAVHDPKFEMSAAEADRLTDVAIPLVGVLWLIGSEL